MRQLALPLSPPGEPTLENFVPGANAELLARLRALLEGRLAESVLYLWGTPGSGRTHLLRACARAARAVADDVETLDETAQIALVTAIDAARAEGGTVLAAGAAPPARLRLRADLRSRLAWGLVYEVKPLDDEQRAAYLRAEGARRGLRVGDEVVRYLLAHARRDLPTLVALMERLDRTALERQRPLTLALVREALRTLA
ncbi:MAG: DnaA/Hda family protein [Burkholderiales bacterium]|nr:DnaA/Hda family protein [Burkholderiales bacterium]